MSHDQIETDPLTDGETPPEAWIQGYLDRQDGKPYVGREYVTLREREDYWDGWQVGEEDLTSLSETPVV